MKFEKSKYNMKEPWSEILTLLGKGKRQTPRSKFRSDNGNVIIE